MKRREFITLPAKCLGGLLLCTLAGVLIRITSARGHGSSCHYDFSRLTRHE
jgi:hypothetical protein